MPSVAAPRGFACFTPWPGPNFGASYWNWIEPCGAPRLRRLSVSPFLGNRLQPPWPSLSSKGQTGTVANQGRGRRSQETVVQPWGWLQEIHIIVSLSSPAELKSLTNGRYSVQFSSIGQLCLTLCDPMDCNTPGIPVHHQLLEFTQTHVHWVGDAIQSSHPLSSPSPPAFNLSQHQRLFKWVSSLHQVAKVLEFHLQHQSF